MSTFSDIARLIDSGYSISEALSKVSSLNFVFDNDVGIGATPTKEFTNSPALRMGETGAYWCYPDQNNVLNNAYYDGSFKYLTTNTAQAYRQIASIGHRFSVAASGTEDDTISWTVALLIDNSANATFSGNVSLDTQLNIANIPTSASGLSSGDVWSNGGVLTIV